MHHLLENATCAAPCPAVPPLLRHLQAEPDDAAARLILADLLDEEGPGEVVYVAERPILPNWLRLGWIRNQQPSSCSAS